MKERERMGQVNDIDGLYDRGFEAGVQAERERIRAQIDALPGPSPTTDRGYNFLSQSGYLAGKMDALAVVTGKGGQR
jgi:hypothetical protein